MTWPQFLSYFVPSGGIFTIAALLFNARRKSSAGKLTRAQLQNLRADKAEKLAARYLAYVWQLRGQWPAGSTPPPWPRSLKPKE